MRSTERSFYLGFIALLLLFVVILQTCKKSIKCDRLHCDSLQTDTVVVLKRDTVFIVKRDSSEWHHPKEYFGIIQDNQWPLIKKDSSVTDSIHSDNTKCDSIMKDYFDVKYYSDTNKIRGGHVIVNNIVRNNRLAFQRVFTKWDQLLIKEKEHVSTTAFLKPKGQLFAGLIAQGQADSPLKAFGGQIAWKTKGERIWTFSVMQQLNGPVIYQAGHLFKLSFK